MREMLLAAALLLFAAGEDSLATSEKLIASGDHARALALLAAAPVSVQRHLLASRAHDGLGDPASAVREAESALALDPRSEAAHLQLGRIFLGHNTPQAAAEVFAEALAIHPDSLFLRLGRGLAYKELARHDDAERDLRACLARRPDLNVTFDALATVLLHARRFDELAALAVERARRPRRDYRASYWEAAALDGLEGDSARIRALAAEAIRLEPGFAAAHALLGKARLKADDAAGAIGPLETAIRLRPDLGPAALHLAQAYQRAGRSDDAAAAFRRVREIKEREQHPKPSLVYHRGTK